MPTRFRETICRVVVVSGCGEHEHHGDAGRREIGAGCRGRRCHGRGCGAVEGREHPWPRSRSNGLRRRVRPGLLLAAGLDVGPVLGCLRLPNRVPLASSTIADLSRRSRHCAAAGGSRPPTSTGGSIAWRERHGGLLRSHRRICCKNRAIEFRTLRGGARRASWRPGFFRPAREPSHRSSAG